MVLLLWLLMVLLLWLLMVLLLWLLMVLLLWLLMVLLLWLLMVLLLWLLMVLLLWLLMVLLLWLLWSIHPQNNQEDNYYHCRNNNCYLRSTMQLLFLSTLFEYLMSDMNLKVKLRHSYYLRNY